MGDPNDDVPGTGDAVDEASTTLKWVCGVVLVLALAGIVVLGVGNSLGWRVCTTDSRVSTDSAGKRSSEYDRHCHPTGTGDQLPFDLVIVAAVAAAPLLVKTLNLSEFNFEGGGVKVGAKTRRLSRLQRQAFASTNEIRATDDAVTSPPTADSGVTTPNAGDDAADPPGS